MVQRIKTLDNETRLLVVDAETHESLRSLRLTATEEMAVVGTGRHNSSPSPSSSPSSLPSPPSKAQENGSVSKPPITASNQVQKPARRSPPKAAKQVRLLKWMLVVRETAQGQTVQSFFTNLKKKMSVVISSKAQR